MADINAPPDPRREGENKRRIEAYWRERGHQVLVEFDNGRVRSNMRNGLPYEEWRRRAGQ